MICVFDWLFCVCLGCYCNNSFKFSLLVFSVWSLRINFFLCSSFNWMGFLHFYGKFSPEGNVHIRTLEFGYPLTLFWSSMYTIYKMLLIVIFSLIIWLSVVGGKNLQFWSSNRLKIHWCEKTFYCRTSLISIHLPNFL